MEGTFSVDSKYYPQKTHIWNLPAGWSCPWADQCYTKADKHTGKLTTRPDKDKNGLPIVRVDGKEPYVCYAARSERFPTARDSRWRNFHVAKANVHNSDTFTIPAKATHVRVHGSGDFFNEPYFCLWLETAEQHPEVHFWAFTKSLRYWVNHLDEVPPNFSLVASRGGKEDHLIDEYGLKTAEVFMRLEDVPEDMVIDMDDTEAMYANRPSFALLENMANKDQRNNPEILAHNERARVLQAAVDRAA